jgi:hypothetical protein
MKFKITNIIQDRSIDGFITIEAEAIDEFKTIISITYKKYPGFDLSEKSISILLNNAYKQKRTPSNNINIGDII